MDRTAQSAVLVFVFLKQCSIVGKSLMGTHGDSEMTTKRGYVAHQKSGESAYYCLSRTPVSFYTQVSTVVEPGLWFIFIELLKISVLLIASPCFGQRQGLRNL